MVFASAGYRVSVFDAEQGKAANVVKDIGTKLQELEKNGSLRGKLSAIAQSALIHSASSLKECVEGAFFIQESGPEVLEVKIEILKEVDSLMENGVILSSSSSALLPSELSSNLAHKNSFLVAHPANPPYFVPIVELVPAPWTDQEVLQQTQTLMSEVGQSPITCKKEQPGFALSRMQYALINECWKLVQDGYLKVKDIDTVMSEGLGRRYAFLGPFETAHLNAEGMVNYLEKYGNMIYDVSKTFGPIPTLDGSTAKDIEKQLCEMVPLEQLEAKRHWRDDSLAALDKLRQEIDN